MSSDRINIPRLMIAAPESGSGKTTITSGLIVALGRRGRQIQPFKVGPDYIDPSYHALAAGRPCRNLDTWMLGREQVLSSFVYNSRQADIAIIEGVMGLFDGASSLSNVGSTADVSALLQAPVILIINARGMARSVAALVHGYHTFDSQIRLGGVILNRVGSVGHADLCTAAIEQMTDVPVLGYLLRDESISLPERHLGLIPTAEAGQWKEVIDQTADRLEATVDLDRLEDLASAAPHLDSSIIKHRGLVISNAPAKPVRIALAVDEAFSFTYPENVELLEAAGATIVPFSPLHDRQLPSDIDALILSGGFPELYGAQLSQNRPMLDAIRAAGESDLLIYAECGGLMVLTQGIKDLEDDFHPMVGLLDGYCQMEPKVRLGYRILNGLTDGPILAVGEETRAHEFHYSSWQEKPRGLSPAFEVKPRRSYETTRSAGAVYKRVWASYMHVHFGANPNVPARFVNFAAQK